MFVPLITSTESSSSRRRAIIPRKGGGGGGGRGGGGGGRGGSGGSKGGSSKGGSSGGSKGTTSNFGSSSSSGRSSYSISSGGKSFSASTYSYGGIPKTSIPSGQPFAGREVGGGNRGQVYGSSVYGSGYPDQSSRGVSDRGFPFVFYPIVYPLGVGAGAGYLYREGEYGKIDNSTRPGGPLTQLSMVGSNYTIRVTADQMTINALSSNIQSCASSNGLRFILPTSTNSSEYVHPKPEEALQYYRASSVVLSLEPFNNSIAYNNNDTSMLYVSIPSGFSSAAIQCANQTIGEQVLLPSSGSIMVTPHTMPMFFIFWFFVLYQILF